MHSKDKFKDPDPATAKLLDRWENGDWYVPDGKGWDEWWENQTTESKKEFTELSVKAVHSAPW